MAFNDTVELAARLVAFATSRSHAIEGDTPIQRVSEQLAHRDLIAISLSVRRLAEITETQNTAKDTFVPQVRPYASLEKAGFYPIKEKISVWKLIGVIIHHQEFEIFKDDAKVRLAFGAGKGDFYKMYKIALAKRHINAVCIVKSDESEFVQFAVADYVQSIVKIIEVTERKLSDLDIYVGVYETDD